jgi:hypothetical protein
MMSLIDPGMYAVVPPLVSVDDEDPAAVDTVDRDLVRDRAPLRVARNPARRNSHNTPARFRSRSSPKRRDAVVVLALEHNLRPIRDHDGQPEFFPEEVSWAIAVAVGVHGEDFGARARDHGGEGDSLSVRGVAGRDGDGIEERELLAVRAVEILGVDLGGLSVATESVPRRTTRPAGETSG